MDLRDVFISYSHHDRDWVSGVLVPNLESRDFSVTVDYRDFRSGAIGVDEMARGVENCRHTLVVLSKKYVESDWSAFENAMAQATDPNARIRKIIPVLYQDCTIPLRIKILHYRDLRSDDLTEWERLYRDLI